MSLVKREEKNAGPDTLQDLCIFYCINNLESLVNNLMNLREAGEASAFSLLLGNKLLDYYLEYHVPSERLQEVFGQLLQNSHLCNSLRLNRQNIVTIDNMFELSLNLVKYIELTIFSNVIELRPGYFTLVENNLQQLVSVKLQQKEHQNACKEILQTLCNSKPDDTWQELNEAGDNNEFSMAFCEPVNQSFRIQRLDTRSSTHIAMNKQSNPATNLQSFSHTTCYSNDPDACVDKSVNELLLQVIKNNQRLQSITIVSADTLPSAEFLPHPVLYSLCNLRSLVLSSDVKASKLQDTETLVQCFVNLPKLKQLQHLDLSYGIVKSKNPGFDVIKYNEVEVALFKEMLLRMPQLKSLDISGTNLASIVHHQDPRISECTGHCMPGFEGRQFHYLGLYYTEECKHKLIPAAKVSGSDTEEQLLVALWSHQHNKSIMYDILQDLRTHIHSLQSNVQKPIAIVEGLITYLDHLKDVDISYADAKEIEMKNVESILLNVYYLLRYRSLENCLNLILRRRLLDLLIVICDNCARDMLTTYGNAKAFLAQIVRIILFIISRLELDELTVYSYGFEKYLRVLIRLVKCRPSAQLMMFILRLVHSACRFSQELKVVAGEKLDLIEVLLEEITAILTMVYGTNDVLGKMWSIIWTLTDEVPVNCELFVKHGGCEITLTTCSTITDDEDLKRKVSGAMCNVSENPNLRPLLMTQPLVKLFRDLLDVYDTGNYDITSHAAAYLVLLAADGPEAWTLEDPTRDEIVAAVDDVIKNHWDIETSKGVKFRSLTPMMLQLRNFSTPTAQHWGAWMILNLVIVKPDRYCEMVVNENGLEIIQRTLEHDELRSDVKHMLMNIRDLTNNYIDRKSTRD